MKQQIKHLSVHQTSKVMATIYAFLFIIFITIPTVIYNFYIGEIAMGIIAFLLSPVLYWVFIYIIQAIGCWIYNLIAEHIGGIEFDLEAPDDKDIPLSSSDKEFL